jgi:hypothetical protein
MRSCSRENLLKAAADVRTGRFHSARQSATFHAVPESSLRHRLLGRTQMEENKSDLNRLSSREEEVLVR